MVVGWVHCLWSEVVWFDSCNFFGKHGLAWCVRNSGFASLQAACAACLAWLSEFPLMLWQRWSPFAKGGWGLTYANKIKKAQVFLAGSTMNSCFVNGEFDELNRYLSLLSSLLYLIPQWRHTVTHIYTPFLSNFDHLHVCTDFLKTKAKAILISIMNMRQYTWQVQGALKKSLYLLLSLQVYSCLDHGESILITFRNDIEFFLQVHSSQSYQHFVVGNGRSPACLYHVAIVFVCATVHSADCLLSNLIA
jgi:hypothetical protein